MKNTDCVIYMTTKNGSMQIYRKDNKGWTQKSSKRIVRRMTSEQLLSHLLPPLAVGNKSKVTIRVEKRKRMKKDSKGA